MRILAIDYGTKYFGFAITDPLRITINLLPPCKANDFYPYFEQIAEYFRTKYVLIGMPVNADGTYGNTAKAVQNFTEELRSKYLSIEFTELNEYGTSRQASKLPSSRLQSNFVGKFSRYGLINRDDVLIHSKSAGVMLYDYINSLPPPQQAQQ
jgi:putative transcription antitermination factor YqgF